mmetsp:Transcript_15384/g.38178  ORF Transcript_15384/g.38178 Transcript_15384/m.38178 type:complete len:208 (-) Transcript_15384:1024-1647(-)
MHDTTCISLGIPFVRNSVRNECIPPDDRISFRSISFSFANFINAKAACSRFSLGARSIQIKLKTSSLSTSKSIVGPSTFFFFFLASSFSRFTVSFPVSMALQIPSLTLNSSSRFSIASASSRAALNFSCSLSWSLWQDSNNSVTYTVSTSSKLDADRSFSEFSRAVLRRSLSPPTTTLLVLDSPEPPGGNGGNPVDEVECAADGVLA